MTNSELFAHLSAIPVAEMDDTELAQFNTLYAMGVWEIVKPLAESPQIKMMLKQFGA